jgi:septal ring factor EnvC (AmiA/AmiB activator)
MTEYDLAPVPPPRTPNKTVRVLAALVIVFFAAAGAFATLWFIERGDHRTTTGQLTASHDEIRDNQAKLTDLDRKLKDSDTKLKQAADAAAQSAADATKAQQALQDRNDCAAAAKDLATAARASNTDAGKKAALTVILACH